MCPVDDCSENDLEVVMDPFLSHYPGTSGSVYLKGNICGPDMFEIYHTGKREVLYL